MKKTKTSKVETLGHDEATIRVKKVSVFWVAGGTVTSDDGATSIKVRCGRGGIIEGTRERAVQWMIYDFARGIADFKSFEKAKAILREIEDSIQPKLF